MADFDSLNSTTIDVATATTDYSVDAQTTDGAEGEEETTYINTRWTQQLGYYKKIPELKSAIDAKAQWTVGKGFTADPQTELLLDTIKGNGKDTFNKILENLLVTKMIGGDAFAEIILDDAGNLANIKPITPEFMKIVANPAGQIIRYEQISRVKGKENKKFAASKIFHLMNKRIADEIHGTSDIDALEEIILARNEAMMDYRELMHRNIEPVIIIHADTDNATKIAKIKTDWETVKRVRGSVWVVPKDTVVPENFGLSPNATLNPLSYINQLNIYFFQSVNVPEIIVGGGTNNLTEASAKIAYLAFQQVIEREQLGTEEDTLSQLNLVIELTFPASLENEALSDKPKQNQDGSQVNEPEIQANEQAVEPNDQQTEMEGRK